MTVAIFALCVVAGFAMHKAVGVKVARVIENLLGI